MQQKKFKVVGILELLSLNLAWPLQLYQRPRTPASDEVESDLFDGFLEGVVFKFEHSTRVRGTLAEGEPTFGASVSGAGTPTPFRSSFPTFGTNRLGFGAETPTPGEEAFRLEVRQFAFGEIAFTLELCATAVVNNAGRKAKDKIATPGASKTL
jgi:hypothetical protein